MIYPTISIKQPWAERILNPDIGKDVENRTWEIPQRMTGKIILLHTGKKVDPHAGYMSYGAFHPSEELPTGGIVGAVIFSHCPRGFTSQWAEEGFCHWRIVKAVRLPFYSCNGKLGFFYVDYPHEVGNMQ